MNAAHDLFTLATTQQAQVHSWEEERAAFKTSADACVKTETVAAAANAVAVLAIEKASAVAVLAVQVAHAVALKTAADIKFAALKC